MAKNREPEKVVYETESGEEEDDEASFEEETGSESEPEQTVKKPSSSTGAATIKRLHAQPASRPQPSSSSDEEEEEVGSESDPDSDGPDPKVRPLASKPMGDVQKSGKKPRSKLAESDLVTPTRSTAAGKRPAEEKETEAKEAKKSRKKFESLEKKPVDDPKKNLFQRLWSEDDEIVILKGMIDYMDKKKSDPVADLNAFLDFIKKNLQVDVTKTQLQDKIRRLRKKYENNKSKEKEGKERTFSKSHEQKVYELSKDIWGVQKVVGNPKANGSVVSKEEVKSVVSKEEVKSVVVVDEDKSPARRVCASVEEWIMMKGVKMFEGEKGVEGEKEWKKLRMDEVESYVKHVETKAAQLRFLFNKMSSAGY